MQCLPTAGRKFNRAVLNRHHVVEARRRAERSCIPIRRSLRAGYILVGQELWPAIGTKSTRPRQPVYKFLGQQNLAVGAVEHIEEPVPIRMEHELPLLPSIARIDQNTRLGGVIRVNVVRSELVIPFQLAGVGIHSEDAFREEVIAWPVLIIVIGIRSGGGPVESASLRIIGAGHPRAAASEGRFFALPGLVTRLSLAGYRPEPPHAFAG